MWYILAAVVVVLTILKVTNKLDPIYYFVHLGMAVVVTLLCVFLASFNFEATDYELWNGEISSKVPKKQDCPYGWVSSKDDFCTEYRTRQVKTGESCSTDSKGNKSCSPIYDTEYKYDYRWERRYFVYAKNIGGEWEVERVDAQGVQTPPFFNTVAVGDPASTSNRYLNWVMASSETIFKQDGEIEEKYKELIPAYPKKLYDFYKVDRIVPVGVTVPELWNLNNNLSIALKQLGPKKQMNAIIVVVDAAKAGPDFPLAVRRAWQGFRKNDAVVFIGLRDGNLEWTDVLSWSKASIFDITLREKILQNQNKPLDLNNVIAYLSEVGMTNYERRSMKEFEFLRDELSTPIWIYVIQIFTQLLALVGMTVFLNRKFS